MTRDEAMARLRAHEAELKRLGVQQLFMFGSTARGELTPRSDVDLFFDYDKGRFSLFDLMDVKDFASETLGVRADITTRDSLHRVLRRAIEAEAIQVF